MGKCELLKNVYVWWCIGECFGRGVTMSKQTIEVEKSEEKKGFQNVKITIMWIQLGWFRLFLESMLSIEGEKHTTRGPKLLSCCNDFQGCPCLNFNHGNIGAYFSKLFA